MGRRDDIALRQRRTALPKSLSYGRIERCLVWPVQSSGDLVIGRRSPERTAIERDLDEDVRRLVILSEAASVNIEIDRHPRIRTAGRNTIRREVRLEEGLDPGPGIRQIKEAGMDSDAAWSHPLIGSATSSVESRTSVD